MLLHQLLSPPAPLDADPARSPRQASTLGSTSLCSDGVRGSAEGQAGRRGLQGKLSVCCLRGWASSVGAVWEGVLQHPGDPGSEGGWLPG